MKKNKVVVFNSHGIGQYAYTDKMPNWGETLSVSKWHIAEDGGKGSNVSVALGRLGIPTSYIGKVGNDPWGDLGEKWMKNAGVDTTYLYRTNDVATGTGLILIGPNGENAIIDGDSSSEALTEDEVINAIDGLGASEYFISGFEVPYRLSLLGAKYAHEKGSKVVLNPSPIEDIDLGDLSYVDYLFINANEANILLRRNQSEEIKVPNDLHALQSEFNLNSIVITLGEDGIVALHDNQIIRVEAKHVNQVVNTAGAGDGFMAATVAKIFEGSSLEEAMEWASYYAALSVTIDGTIPAYRPKDEVEEFIRNY